MVFLETKEIVEQMYGHLFTMESPRTACSRKTCEKTDELQIVRDGMLTIAKDIEDQISILDRICDNLGLCKLESDVNRTDVGAETNALREPNLYYEQEETSSTDINEEISSRDKKIAELEQRAKTRESRIDELAHGNNQLQQEVDREKKRAEHFEALCGEKEAQINFFKAQLQLVERVARVQKI